MNRNTAARKIQSAFRRTRRPKSFRNLPTNAQMIIAKTLSPGNRQSLFQAIQKPSNLEKEYTKRSRVANARWGKLARTLTRTPMVRPARNYNSIYTTIRNLHNLKKFVQANGGRLPSGLTTENVNSYIRAANRVSALPRNVLHQAIINSADMFNSPFNSPSIRRVLNALQVNRIPSANITVANGARSPASLWLGLVKFDQRNSYNARHNNNGRVFLYFTNSKGREKKVRWNINGHL